MIATNKIYLGGVEHFAWLSHNLLTVVLCDPVDNSLDWGCCVNAADVIHSSIHSPSLSLSNLNIGQWRKIAKLSWKAVCVAAAAAGESAPVRSPAHH